MSTSKSVGNNVFVLITVLFGLMLEAPMIIKSRARVSLWITIQFTLSIVFDFIITDFPFSWCFCMNVCMCVYVFVAMARCPAEGDSSVLLLLLFISIRKNSFRIKILTCDSLPISIVTAKRPSEQLQ